LASLEKILLSALNFNDEAKLSMETLNFVPAQAKAKLAENPNADGVLLVEEPQFTPSYFEIQLRVVNAKTSIDEALTTVGEVIDVLTACAKIEGGAEIEWTPAESVQAYTAYALLGELLEIPITPSGELAGWFVKFPVLKIKLTCRPFLFQDERVVLSLVESTGEPLQVAYIKGILGDVPAEARLLVKDTASADRRFGQWGRDTVETETNPPLTLSAASGLTGTNFSGTAATRAGAYGAGEAVLRGIAVTQATVLAGTGRIEDIGAFAVYMRAYVPLTGTLFRLAYKNGDSGLSYLEWETPTVVGGWSDTFMGEVSLDEVERGLQTSELRIEQRAVTGNGTNDLNFLLLIPISEGAGKARGIAPTSATSLIGLDNFGAVTGNLEGQTPTYPATGTTWAEVNKTGASGFLETSGEKNTRRTAVSDTSLYAGCIALLGTTALTASKTSVTFNSGSAMRPTKNGAFGETLVQQLSGLIVRYVDTEHWIALVLYQDGFIPGVPENAVSLGLVKRTTAGTIFSRISPVSSSYTGYLAPGGVISGSPTLTFQVLPNGVYTVTGGVLTSTGQDADLATGGQLASGRAGIYDAYISAEAGTRRFSAFQSLGAEEATRVCYSGRQVEYNSQACARQDATGVYMGPPSVYRGAGFYLEPAGKLNLVNRVAVRMRRNDIVAEPDANVTDKQAIEVLARERFLAPR
jgi:hypothetical protein